MQNEVITLTSSFLQEVLLVVLGAVIGFGASLITIIIQRALDKMGKLNIFYCFSNQQGMNGRTWGFEDDGDGNISFVLPVVFEIQNTSNTTRVIRDVSFLLYQGKKFVVKMEQAEHFHITTRSGNTVKEEKDIYFGAEKGSYSFVIPPRSIQRQQCEYLFSISKADIDNYQFDTVVARYFDECNKTHYFTLRKIENCWTKKLYPIDKEWLLFKKDGKFKWKKTIER